jgi:zinc protease
VLTDARVPRPAWSRSYLAPSYVAGETRHAYALQLLADVLGGGATSRLYRTLVVERTLAVSAGAGYDADQLGPTRFVFYATPRPGVSVEAVEAAVEAEIRRVLADGIDADELARAKARMEAEAVYARDSARAGARLMGSALSIGRTVDDVEAWPERIAAVTVDQVNAAAQALLQDGRSVTAVLAPDGDT